LRPRATCESVCVCVCKRPNTSFPTNTRQRAPGRISSHLTRGISFREHSTMSPRGPFGIWANRCDLKSSPMEYSNWTPVSACCFDSSVRLQRRSEGAGYSVGIGGVPGDLVALTNRRVLWIHRPCPGRLRTYWHSDPIRAVGALAQLTCQRTADKPAPCGSGFIRGLLVDPAFSREADRSSSICGEGGSGVH